MSKIITIKSCSECQYTNEHEDFCTEAEKVICNPYIIPDWCPLPDKDGDKEGDNNEKERCKYELNKRCTHADTGDSCSRNCCCYCKYLHQMTCSFYCGIAADLVHGIEDGDNNG